MNYYNEFDPYAAEWLRNLIRNGVLPEGKVDERDIREVQGSELSEYTQCHFFAGIGGWPLALRQAGWPDNRPVWTGSCPCQPFSAAGKGRGTADSRHLWPDMCRLIAECQPPRVFGEQVASKAGRLWFSGVRADLEALGYGVGTADLCAAGIGAPHIRQRLFWVADSAMSRRERSEQEPEGETRDETRMLVSGASGRTGGLGNGIVPGLEGHAGNGSGGVRHQWEVPEPGRSVGEAGLPDSGVAHTGHEAGSPERRIELREHGTGSRQSSWSDFHLVHCRDGKTRRISSQPGDEPLAYGLPRNVGSLLSGVEGVDKAAIRNARRNRVGRLKGYGNAIVTPLAAEFISAFMESESIQPMHQQSPSSDPLHLANLGPATPGGPIGNGSLADYGTFLAGKRVYAPDAGFDVDLSTLNPHLFEWQSLIIRWALRRGRAAIFADCGLGKTIMQLEWAHQVSQHTGGGKVLLLAPLAVGPQTAREAERFGIFDDLDASPDGTPPPRTVAFSVNVKPGTNITNYERLHHFDPAEFVGVVLDESSILKNFTGVIKRQLIESFRDTPYRLACTATPAPNDNKELGNHAEFLGIMSSNEMLARWFINDSKHVGNYRLRKHARADFWAWVASWAVCVSKPSDLGFSDEGYDLPPLNIHEHVVDSPVPPGHLFHPATKVSATKVHQEKRGSLAQRAEMVADLVNSSDGKQHQWAVWCDTNYEADELARRIPDAVDVRGSQSPAAKEKRFLAFQDGESRVCITKPEIGGYGLNWQFCHKTTWFAGYSYEKFYQAIRRMWRFGQPEPVDVHVVMSESEQSIAQAVQRKQGDHEAMKAEMAAAMMDFQIENVCGRSNRLAEYVPTTEMEVPAWLKAK